MLNGSVVWDESQALARRIESEVGSDRRARIVRAFTRVLNREPYAEEVEAFLAFRGPLDGICRVLFNSNDFLYVD